MALPVANVIGEANKQKLHLIKFEQYFILYFFLTYLAIIDIDLLSATINILTTYVHINLAYVIISYN